MCHGLTGPTHDGTDEWFLDNPAIRTFIGEVQRIRAEESDPTRVVSLIEPAFQLLQLLLDADLRFGFAHGGPIMRLHPHAVKQRQSRRC